MRILQVDSARTIGGGETHVLELTETLRQRGHDVALAGRAEGPLKADIEMPFLNSLDLLTVSRLRRLLARKHFDLVHAHVARDYPVVSAALWGLPRTKLVITRHLLYPLKGRFLYRRVDGWIATTPQVLLTLERQRPRRTVIIPNWVDTNKFPFRPHSLHDPVVFGLLGQISPHKGHDDAVDALRLLGRSYRLVIAGEGQPDYIHKLKQRAAGLDVEFIGFVPAVTFLDGVDILAVPSWEEPFGVVLLEAMASGIPVVATDAGGPREIVDSGTTGLLVPRRDPPALAEAIRSIAREATLLSEIVHKARRHVEQHYDISFVVPKIEEFYRSLA